MSNLATAQALRELRESQAALARLAERELRQFFDTIKDTEDPMVMRRALEQFLPALIAQYGEIGAAVARDFYEDARDGKGMRAFRTVMADVVPREAIAANTRWAVTPFFKTRDVGQTLSNLLLVTDKATKAAGRDTIALNAERDAASVRFARVPNGPQTCKFCLMTASRGAVYTNERSAGQLKEFHGHCDCQIVPVFDDDDYPEGYNPDALLEQWEALRD